ncbi:hypothetical protein Hanom_Chr09g00769811 [Helianthus anomalus]
MVRTTPSPRKLTTKTENQKEPWSTKVQTVSLRFTQRFTNRPVKPAKTGPLRQPGSPRFTIRKCG